MGIVQRLLIPDNIFLTCFFGDLLRLGKFSKATTEINLKMILPSLEYWLGVCWSMIDNNISRCTRRLKRLRNTLTTDTELNELSIYLATDSANFISEFL